jgi:acetone carboxylase gamma subunit
MNVYVTEYLKINLDTEQWQCRKCEHEIGSARDSYKKGMKLYKRDPQEIHKPLLDPELYHYTFAPSAELCSIIECYCPGCGVLVETEYVPAGFAPTIDMEFDIDGLKQHWQSIGEVAEPGVGPDVVNLKQCNHQH